MRPMPSSVVLMGSGSATERMPPPRAARSWTRLRISWSCGRGETFGLAELDGFFGPLPLCNRPVKSGRWADFTPSGGCCRCCGSQSTQVISRPGWHAARSGSWRGFPRCAGPPGADAAARGRPAEQLRQHGRRRGGDRRSPVLRAPGDRPSARGHLFPDGPGTVPRTRRSHWSTQGSMGGANCGGCTHISR